MIETKSYKMKMNLIFECITSAVLCLLNRKLVKFLIFRMSGTDIQNQGHLCVSVALPNTGYVSSELICSSLE
jgi:hypothetical protein